MRWISLATAVAVAAAWLAQLRYQADLRVGECTWISMRAGCAHYVAWPLSTGPAIGWPRRRLCVRTRSDPQSSPQEWSWGFLVFHDLLGMKGLIVQVPMWAIFGIAALPAAGLWIGGRRATAGCCCSSCGYDRSGLAVGVKCPECGTVVIT